MSATIKRMCFALDLIDEESSISAYGRIHQPDQIWKEVIQSIKDAGVVNMEIYRVLNRLFMIMEVHDDFSLAKKALMDANNPLVQKWERLMQEKYQQALPGSTKIEWVPMQLIFDLSAC